MASAYIATLLNPKRGATVVVEAWATAHPHFVVAEAGTKGQEVVGQSYVEDEDGGSEFARIHTPEGVVRPGMGLGFMLYCGTALGVAEALDLRGVYSVVGNRSASAERFWKKIVDSKLATRVDGVPEEEEVEHCVNVEGDEVDDGRIVHPDELCGPVTVERPGPDRDYLRAEAVLAAGVVVHHAEQAVRFALPPIDLLAQATANNARVLWNIGERIADAKIRRAFLSRPDVQEVVAGDPTVLHHFLEFFGQRRLPGVEGLARSGRLVEPEALPALSRESRAILDRFRDLV